MIIMDLYPRNLSIFLASPIDLEIKKNLSLDVMSGLMYLHSETIIHRDLKTSNILITDTSRACIADFGLSKSINSLTNIPTYNAVGTPTYMAPEICMTAINNRTYTKQSDYYALGIILWEIFENNPRPYINEYPQFYDIKNFSIFEIAPYIHNNNLRPILLELTKQNLSEVKDIIEKLWQTDPTKRPENLTSALETIGKLSTTKKY